LRAAVGGIAHAREDFGCRVDGVRGPAQAQTVALQADDDRHEVFERGKISVEMTAETERIADPRELEYPFCASLRQRDIPALPS
jgi:hypothetical protein